MVFGEELMMIVFAAGVTRAILVQLLPRAVGAFKGRERQGAA